MNARLKEIRERLAAIKPDIETLGSAETLSEDEETRLSDSITEWDTLTEEAKPLEAREAKLSEIRKAAAVPGATESGDGATGGVQVMRQVEPFADGDDIAYMRPEEARDKARKALDSDELTGHLDERQKVAMEKLLRTHTGNTKGSEIAKRMLATESPAYRSAFMKLSVQPNAVLTQDEARAIEHYNELRTMQITADASGGFGVPVLIDPTIILTGQGTPNPFFAISRVETITTDEWRGVSSAGVSWSFDAEGTTPALGEVSDDSPTLAQPTVKAHKAQGFIPFTIEVGQDYPNFAAEMSRLLAEGYSELLVDKFTNGSGTGEPKGIVTALAGTASDLSAAGTSLFVAADVNTLYAALPVRYRQNATWMSSAVINSTIQQFGNGADATFTVDWTPEGVQKLRGRPYELNDYVPSALSSTSPYLIFADFQNFLIAQRAGMSVELVPHLFATPNNRPNGSRGWFAWSRVGSDLINLAGARGLSD